MRYTLAAVVVLFVCLLPASALTVEQEAKLLASDGEAEDSFGRDLELDGDTAFIGAPHKDDNGEDSGAAYMFTRTGSMWTEEFTLLPSDGTSGDQFGLSVALDGDTAVAGAPYDADNGDASGAVYVFTRSGGGWIEQAKLLASDGDAEDYFGGAVALDGDTVLIGARGDSTNGYNSGAAYVFTRVGSAWTGPAKLLPSDGHMFDQFGLSLALDGDNALISSPGDDVNGSGSGSAYWFARVGGVWEEQAKLIASDGDTDDYFGWAVVLDGDTALISARGDDDNGSSSGSAYVFTRVGDAWTEDVKLLASDGEDADFFGYSAALDGDTALIGAFGDDDNGTWAGAAYVFVRAGGVWTEEVKLLASDGDAEDYFGGAVALDGDTALIAASTDDNGMWAGAAYVYRLYDDDVPATNAGGLGMLLVAVLGARIYFFMRRRAAR
jgi:hypothetical protein